MKGKVIKCMTCGSALNIGKNLNQCKCSYCGSVNLLEGKVKKEVVLDANKVLEKAQRYEGDGKDNKAMELYDEFLKINPNEPRVLFARAFISLIDGPDDDFNMELFEEYFSKALSAIKDDKMEVLDFVMYHFRNYTCPTMAVWQTYAYRKLEEIDKRSAVKRLTRNMLLLFEIQNRIVDLVENAEFETLSKSYIDEYKEFQTGIVNMGRDLDHYREYYGARYGFSNKMKIRESVSLARKRYKLFVKKYGK